MPFAPPLYVDTTTAPRSRYGLIDAADEVIPGDPKWINGVEFQPLCRMNAHLDATDCGVPPEYATDGADGRPVETAAPIRIYTRFTCRSMDLTDDIVRRESEGALAFSAPILLEQTLWAPPDDPAPDGPAQLRLMGPDTVILGGGTAVGLVHGIRLLEDYLSTEYGRVGVLHAPAGVSADIGQQQQVRWEAQKPVTVRGTRWSWGAYPYADPEGVAAAAGTAWLAATGAVTLRQSPARVLGNLEQQLDRTTNEVTAIATKTYVVTWECVTAAVLVNLDT